MLDEGSLLERPVRRQVWRSVALGAALACGCANGVDVTDDELAAICSDPSNRCTGVPAAGAGGTNSVGNTGGTSNGGTSSGGTFGSPTAGTGGTNNATGGTGNTGTGGTNNNGTGGTGGTTQQPLAEGDCLAQSDITIGYEDRTRGSTLDSEPSMVLSVQNPSGQDFSLADLTIRYWFTADAAGAFIADIDYASIGGGNNGLQNGDVSVDFGQEFGSDYAEVAFSSTATIGAGGIEQVQVRFHGDPYTAMDQTNDFSYILNATTGTPNPNVTPYLSGTQVGGCVPIGP